MILNLDIPEKILDKPYIKQFLPDNAIVIEAGGHIGRDCIKMAKLWPESTIYSFEPIKELYDTLIINTEKFKNITCFNYALTSYTGKSEIFVSSGRSTALSSLYKPVGGLTTHAETIFTKDTVNTISLDQWAQDNNIKYIDFIWLDTQGAELDALNGATNLLKTVNALFVEVSLKERYKDSTDALKLISWLESQNFIAHSHDKIVHEKANILFLKD